MAAAKRRSEELEGTEYFDLLVREAESEQTGLEIYLPSSRTLLGDDADEACKTMSQAVEMDIAALVEISSESDSASSHDTSETAREAEDQLREDRVLSQ